MVKNSPWYEECPAFFLIFNFKYGFEKNCVKCLNVKYVFPIFFKRRSCPSLLHMVIRGFVIDIFVTADFVPLFYRPPTVLDYVDVECIYYFAIYSDQN